jgi:hypothetical protein
MAKNVALAAYKAGIKTKTKHHRKAKTGISLAIIAGLAPTAAFALEGFKLSGGEGGITEAAHRLTMRMTGYEWKGNNWQFGELAKGWLPLIAGALAHKLAGKYGINRMISNAGIPFIRI